jgi:hypothetical protein
MISDLLALLFHSRDFAHRAHLRTTSYAAHMALGDFYEELPELIDSFTEAYQGRYGIVDIPYVSAPSSATADPCETLQEHLRLVEAVRHTALTKTDSALQSKIDDIVCLYLTTCYKLKNLN